MPVEHAVLDFHPLEEVEDDGTRLLRGLLVAASREMVLNSVHAAQKGGLTPTTVDLSSFAVLRSLGRSSLLGLSGESEALVDIGARVTNIIVHEAGSPRFIRILLMGGQDLTETMAERMGVSLPQAETLKQQRGLARRRERPCRSGPGVGSGDIRGRGPRVARLLPGLAVRVAHRSDPRHRWWQPPHGPDRAAWRRPPASPWRPGNPFGAMAMGKTGLSPEQIQFVEPLAVVPVGLALGAA